MNELYSTYHGTAACDQTNLSDTTACASEKTITLQHLQQASEITPANIKTKVNKKYCPIHPVEDYSEEEDISNQLASNGKSSLMSTINELLKQHDSSNDKNLLNVNHVMDKHITNNHLQKIKQHIISNFKTHQMEMIRSNKKLNFYSIFKTDVSKSEYLEQIKNSNHRKALAKLKAGNHNLRIESGRHCLTKIPEDLRICQYCSSNEIQLK